MDKEQQQIDDNLLIELEEEFGETGSIKAMICAIVKTLTDNGVCTECQIYENLQEMARVLRNTKHD